MTTLKWLLFIIVMSAAEYIGTPKELRLKEIYVALNELEEGQEEHAYNENISNNSTSETLSLREIFATLNKVEEHLEEEYVYNESLTDTDYYQNLEILYSDNPTKQYEETWFDYFISFFYPITKFILKLIITVFCVVMSFISFVYITMTFNSEPTGIRR